jgi:RNA polymerase sigma-70 factor, ECF subfamily
MPALARCNNSGISVLAVSHLHAAQENECYYIQIPVLTNADKSEDGASAQLTALLKRMQRGDRDAGEKAVALVYDELHRIARREFRKERPGHTLVTTALLHEVYIRLFGVGALEIQNRGHFFAIASQQMRRVLIDHARAKNSQRRGGGGIRIALEEARVSIAPPPIDLLLLDEALKDLETVEPRAAKVVELRYFGGYTDKQVAEATGLSHATVRRDWEFARCWLFDRMKGTHGHAPPTKT